MPSEIKINYEAVFSKTLELRQRVQQELQEMENIYRQTSQTLRQLDGSTNAAYVESMEANREKARVTAETLTKLINFIDASAKHVEREENNLSRTFERSRITASRRR